MNNVNLIGRLARDLELRYTANGKSVGNTALAVEENYKGEDGKRPVNFINLVFFGKTADFASQYLKKGARAAINGKIQQRRYEDKNGNKRESVEVVVNQVEPIDWPNNQSTDSQSKEFEGEELNFSEEDIPF